MSRILPDFRAIGTYDDATGKVTITSDINGFLTATESATKGNYGNNPQGVNYYLKVVKKDSVIDADNVSTLNPDFETGQWSYEDTAGTITFERQTTDASSNSTDQPVNFGADLVEVYGAISPDLFLGSDLKILSTEILVADTDYSDAGINGQVQLSDVFTITPNDANSRLLVAVSGDYQIQGTGGPTAMTTNISIQYQDNLGVWNDIRSKRYGLFNFTGISTSLYFFDISMNVEVDNTMLDINGDWSLRIANSNFEATTTTSQDYTTLNYIEKI